MTLGRLTASVTSEVQAPVLTARGTLIIVSILLCLVYSENHLHGDNNLNLLSSSWFPTWQQVSCHLVSVPAALSLEQPLQRQGIDTMSAPNLLPFLPAYQEAALVLCGSVRV